MNQIESAIEAYERAVFGGDPSGLEDAERTLDSLEAEAALARGMVLHARMLGLDTVEEDPRELELFQRALALFESVNDIGGQARARFWIGVVHQVVRNDQAAALPELRRALDLAEQADAPATRAYILRHLGIAAHGDGDFDRAQALLAESTAIRRELGFDAGVAANLVGLAYVARDGGRLDDATAILDEAMTLTASTKAAGVRRWVTAAARDLAP